VFEKSERRPRHRSADAVRRKVQSQAAGERALHPLDVSRLPRSISLSHSNSSSWIVGICRSVQRARSAQGAAPAAPAARCGRPRAACGSQRCGSEGAAPHAGDRAKLGLHAIAGRLTGNMGVNLILPAMLSLFATMASPANRGEWVKQSASTLRELKQPVCKL